MFETESNGMFHSEEIKTRATLEGLGALMMAKMQTLGLMDM